MTPASSSARISTVDREAAPSHRVPWAAAMLVAMTVAGCADVRAPAPVAAAPMPAAAPAFEWLPQARDVANAVPPKLLAVLKKAIDEQGAAGAITVCRDEAPKLAAQASAATGWQVRRVSLRERNPKAVPDAWERDALAAFDRAVAAGGGNVVLERAAVTVENGVPTRRYIKALPVQPLCVQCHGGAADLGPGVAQRLASLYPNDRGTGYDVGQIRGAVTLRQPAPATR